MKHYDVVIVGAGIVGATCALRLQAQNFSVALIDLKSVQEKFNDLPEVRVSALNQSSVALLQDLAVWPLLAQERVTPILAMALFADAEVMHFDAAEFGFAELGFIIENEVLLHALLKKFADTGGVFFCPYQVLHLMRQSQGWELALQGQDPIQLTADLLVIAQGAHANLRELLGVKTRIDFYQQKALVLNVTSVKPHHFAAYQRFLPTGPLAFLPLFNAHWSSIVWTLPQALADEYLHLSAEDLLYKLTAAFPDLGALSLLSKVFAFELTALAAENYAGEGYVLIGDSAHTVHPLAGQGVNMGLKDVALLVNALSQHGLTNRSLQQYAREARLRNEILSKSFSMLNRVFQVESSAFKRLLNFGFTQLERFHGIKRQLLKLARGDI